jgi:hypothetical protein
MTLAFGVARLLRCRASLGEVAMSNPTPVSVAMRIPGLWTNPKDLIDSLPADCRLTPDTLILPDGAEIGFGAAGADTQFPQIFRNSLRDPATADEMAKVKAYQVNVFLSGPGGSLDSARTMMRAAAVLVRAGGAGVFIDNGLIAHGGEQWLSMTEDGSPDAVSYAFVSIVRGKDEIWTLGMQVLGLRDIVMKRSDMEVDGFDIVEVIRYTARSDKPIEDGHVIADEKGPRFRTSALPGDQKMAGGPVYNPFGRLKLVSLRDIAETN